VAYRATYEDQEWQFVRIPYVDLSASSSDRDERVRHGAVVWTEHEEIDPHGYITEKAVVRGGALSSDVVKAFEQSNADLSAVDTVPVEISHTQLTAGRDDVSAQSSSDQLSSETHSRTIPVAIGETQVSAQVSSDDVVTTQGD
jgi:hypothetical protein